MNTYKREINSKRVYENPDLRYPKTELQVLKLKECTSIHISTFVHDESKTRLVEVYENVNVSKSEDIFIALEKVKDKVEDEVKIVKESYIFNDHTSLKEPFPEDWIEKEEKQEEYKKIKIGVVDGQDIYLSPPSWDCGWYWGWGYLGNRNCHYHLDTLDKRIDFKTAIDNHFGSSYIVSIEERWKVSELFKSFYALKEIAKVYNRGGVHLNDNPCKELIKNKKEVKRINQVLLPAIFKEVYIILNSCLHE